MFKLCITIYSKGYEMGNIKKEKVIFPGSLNVDNDHVGNAKWFVVSEYDPITESYTNPKKYNTEKYCYATEYLEI